LTVGLADMVKQAWGCGTGAQKRNTPQEGFHSGVVFSELQRTWISQHRRWFFGTTRHIAMLFSYKWAF
jgi:hypothetical protein